jgi:hypothetical protein
MTAIKYELLVHRANDTGTAPVTQVIGTLALIKDACKTGRIDFEKGVEYSVALFEGLNTGYNSVLLQVTADAEAVEFLLRRKVRSLGKDAPAPAPIEDAPEVVQDEQTRDEELSQDLYGN